MQVSVLWVLLASVKPTKNMAQAKMETAADRYRKKIAEKAKLETFYKVECVDREQDAVLKFPAIEGCGMEWLAKRAAKDFWITSGIMPSALAAKMVSAAKQHNVAAPEKLMKSMAAEDVMQSIDFSSKVVRYTAADPCIVDENPGPNDIQRAEVMTCCYNTLLRWQMTGGDEAAGLETFPK